MAQAAGGVDRYIRMLLKYLDKEKFENKGIDYYNNRRYQHRLFIQTPMQAHVSAMNRAAWYRFAQKIRRLFVETANINLILFFLSTWRSALHNSIAGFPGAYD